MPKSSIEIRIPMRFNLSKTGDIRSRSLIAMCSLNSRSRSDGVNPVSSSTSSTRLSMSVCWSWRAETLTATLTGTATIACQAFA